MSALTRHRMWTDESGAAAVEFALVVPFLLLIVFGIINFGLIFASQISLNSAARDASRAGVVQPLGGVGLTCAAIATAARNNGGTIGAPSAAVAVTVTGPSGSTCSLAARSSTVIGSGSSPPCIGSSTLADPQLTVKLTNEYTSPVPLVPPSTLTQTATGKFQCEYS
jgi:Flp pilus assembly protein TadG